jgi:hypothetical protein
VAEEFASPTKIVKKLLDETPESTREEIRKQVKEAKGMIAYHPTLGRMVRNRFGLWKEDNPYTAYINEEDPKHPDNLSGLILEAYWLCIVSGVSPELAAQQKGLA